MGALRGLVALGVLLVAALAAAQPPILYDGTVGDPGAPATRAFGPSGVDYLLEADRGRLLGGSALFHSFSRFGIPAGDAASFLPHASAEVRSIFARVTGDAAAGLPSRSEIFGRLRSEIDGADLYLLNPAGVLFGPSASLDVKGSLHVSSADSLGFSNGLRLFADPGLDGRADSVLDVAPSEAFDLTAYRFESEAPASIFVDQALLEVKEGEALVLVGGDVTVAGDGVSFGSAGLLAPGGRIVIASVASPGEAAASVDRRGRPGVDVEAFPELGTVALTDGARVDVSGGAGRGSVAIQAGDVDVLGGSQVQSQATADVPGGAIDVDARGSVRIAGILEDASDTTRSGLFTDTPSGSGAEADGGRITVRARVLEMRDGSRLRSDTEGAGDAGDIRIEVARLTLAGGAGEGCWGNASASTVDWLSSSGSPAESISTVSRPSRIW